MGLNSTKKDRKVDIIFCIDGTGSMSPCIGQVKANAKKFYQDFVDKMTNDFDSNVEELSIKVITFRDYSENDQPAMVQSEWFELTAGDEDAYSKHLSGIVADGGGDDPENGLEALFYAMTSDWNAKGDNDRQVIVLFTDADAIPLGKQAGQANYPDKMVDYEGLKNTWYCVRPEFLSQADFKLKERCKRLVMFGPAGSVYEQLQKDFNRSLFVPVKMDAGLRDMDFEDVIKIIAASASAV